MDTITKYANEYYDNDISLHKEIEMESLFLKRPELREYFNFQIRDNINISTSIKGTLKKINLLFTNLY